MGTPLTPEQLVLQMSVAEVQELLAALAMDHALVTAERLKYLVEATSCLESAIEILNQEAPARRAA